MPTRAVVENIFTLAIAGATVVGMYAIGAGAWCMLGLVLLFNLNTPAKAK